MLGEAGAQVVLLQCASLHTAAISSLPVCQGPSLRVVFKFFVVSPKGPGCGEWNSWCEGGEGLSQNTWGKVV